MQHNATNTASASSQLTHRAGWQHRMLLHPWLLLLATTLLALGLRLYHLGYRDYWDDEIISTLAARASLSQIYFSIQDYSVHPPLYYMLLHLWGLLFGDELYTLRLLSVLFSIACVPLIYLLGRSLRLPAVVALVAAGLFAISPMQIFHAQQARMYPLLALITIVTVLLFLWAWRAGGWLRWLGFGLSVGMGCYVHVYFPLSVAALNIWALWESSQQRRIDRQRWGGFLAAQACGVALFLPFVPRLLDNVGNVTTSFWAQPITPLDGVFALVGLSNFATAYEQLFQNQLVSLAVGLFGALAGALVLVPALVYSVREAWRHPAERSTWVLLHALIWGPLLLATFISLTIKPIFNERYLIGVAPFLLLVFGWMFSRFWQLRSVQAAAAAFLVSIGVLLTGVYPATPQTSSLIEMAHYLSEAQQPGDAVAYLDWQSFDAAVLVSPEQEDIFLVPGANVWNSTEEWRGHMEFLNWHSPQNVQPVAEFGPDYQRVWLVLTRYTMDGAYHQQTTQAWLEEHGEQIDVLEYKRGLVLLYELDEPASAAPDNPDASTE
jgi:uncharacterized membrane protein